MLRRALSAALLAFVVVPSTPIAAQVVQGNAPATPRPGFNWVIEGAFEFGGDDILELTFTNGSTQTLTLGQGGTIAFGGQLRPASVPRLAIGATIGYKFVTNASSNSNIGITRIPIEVVGRWSLTEDWWAGAGFTTHSAVNVNGDGSFDDFGFDASGGPTLELGWRWIALTYTAMDYTAPDGETLDASAFGVAFRWVIPRK